MKEKLIWAIDPLHFETKPSLNAFQEIALWAGKANWEIQPVAVVTPSRHEMERGELSAMGEHQEACEDFLESFPPAQLLVPEILVNEDGGQNAAVKCLLQYAQEQPVAAMAVCSHGRKGLDRMMNGSFAESLLQSSPYPLFFLSQSTHQSGAETRDDIILIPTDFSETALHVFRAFLETNAQSKPELILFHSVSYPIPSISGMGVFMPADYLNSQKKRAELESARWLHEAHKFGLQVRVVVAEGNLPMQVAEEIEKAAENYKAGSIVLFSHGSAFDRALQGSVSYPLFRAGRMLTLVYGTKAVELAMKKAPRIDRIGA